MSCYVFLYLLLFIVLAVPTQPQKVKKPEEDSTSGEENSEDDDLVAENSAPLEDEVPTKVCLCLIYGSSLLSCVLGLKIT